VIARGIVSRLAEGGGTAARGRRIFANGQS
jgi:hypothetical protein